MSLLNLLIIGHGSQAQAWASNLKQSNITSTIGLRSNSKSIVLANDHGFPTLEYDSISETITFDGIILLTPDHTHLSILETISPRLSKPTRIIYAHGFSMEKDRLHEKFLSTPIFC